MTENPQLEISGYVVGRTHYTPSSTSNLAVFSAYAVDKNCTGIVVLCFLNKNSLENFSKHIEVGREVMIRNPYISAWHQGDQNVTLKKKI